MNRFTQAVATFREGVAQLAWPWKVLVALQTLANGLLPLAFLPSPEAQATLVAYALNCALMLLIVMRTGFSRMIGLGHIFWYPLVIWLATQSPLMTQKPWRMGWLLTLLIVNGFSLTIDTVDLIRYARGERDDRA